MILVMIKQRLTSTQAVQDICRMGEQAFQRYESPGWRRGSCVVSTSDPQQVVFFEEWGSRTSFDAWYNSPARAKYEEQTALLRVGPVQVEVYEEV
jgi:quinol monooxygenase YgiN